YVQEEVYKRLYEKNKAKLLQIIALSSGVGCSEFAVCSTTTRGMTTMKVFHSNGTEKVTMMRKTIV
ncbi:hypothetical protein PC129_g11895, partial [Phytophthora cactorum]